jgi:hypothetical protein
MNKRKRVAWNKHRKHIKKLEERRKAIALATGQVQEPVKKREEPVDAEIKKPLIKKVEKEAPAPKKTAPKVEAADTAKKKIVKKAKPETPKTADADEKKPARKKKTEPETA